MQPRLCTLMQPTYAIPAELMGIAESGEVKLGIIPTGIKRVIRQYSGDRCIFRNRRDRNHSPVAGAVHPLKVFRYRGFFQK